MSSASGKTVGVGDPLSWLMIRVGWKVFAADGSEVGEVDEIAGDDTEDIFDGLAIATSSFGKAALSTVGASRGDQRRGGASVANARAGRAARRVS